MILVPLSIYSLMLGTSTGISGISIFGIACLVGVVFGLAIFLWSMRLPMDQILPMPALVRWSFVIFIIALLIVGIRMVLQAPEAILSKAPPEFKLCLTIYTGVVIYSGLLAVYYLFLHGPTRSLTWARAKRT